MKQIFTLIGLLTLVCLRSTGQTSQSFTTAGTHIFTVPAGVTSLTVECWGGGGAGGGTSGRGGAGGGGAGGGYIKATISVTPSTTFNVYVGQGGVAQNGATGGNGDSSFFSNLNFLRAGGGVAGAVGPQDISGAGGSGSRQNVITASATNVLDSVGNAGQNGFSSNSNAFGGRGGKGRTANGGLGGVPQTSTNVNGNSGSAPGGGGGGGLQNPGQGSSTAGGAGGAGRVIVTYTCPSISITGTSAATPVCVTTASTITVTSTQTGLPVGSYSVVYDIAGANAAANLSATLSVSTAGTGTFNTANFNSAGNSTITIKSIQSPNTSCITTISSNNTAAVVVNPSVTVGTVNGTSPLCLGATANYTVTSSTAGGIWSSSNTDIATVDASTGVVTAKAAGTVNITYTVSSGCAAPKSASKSLTVSPDVTAGTINGTSPLCAGSTANYTATGGTAGGTWSSNNTAVATVNSTTGVVTAVAAGGADITYTVNAGCAAPKSASKSLTVNPIVTAGTVAGSSPLCIGATTTYTTTNATAGGIWSSSNTAIATVDASTGVVTAKAAGTVNITYTVSSGCAAPKSASKSLTVSPDVTAGTINGTSPLCAGSTANYTATGGTAGGTWSSSNTAVATVNSTTGVVTAVAAGGADITYTVNAGCAAPKSASKSLTVNTAPDAMIVSDPKSVCSGTGAGVLVSSVSGGLLNYTTTVNGGTPVPQKADLAANATTTLNDVVTEPTTFTLVSIAGSNGCVTSLSGSVVISVYPLPPVAEIEGLNTPIALGRTVTLTDATKRGTWSTSDATVANIIAQFNALSPARARVRGEQTGTATITYTTQPDENGCTNNASLLVQVYDPSIVRYRTTGGGNWSAAVWEQTTDNGQTWTLSAAPNGNATNVEIRHHTVLDVDYAGSENASLLLTSFDGTDAILEIAPNHYLRSDGGVNFNDKPVIVQSDLTGSGAIGSVTDGEILGASNVTVQRFIGSSSFPTSRRAWQLITAPVTGVTINNSWQEGLVTETTDPLVGDPNYGTLITGWTQHTAANAFSHGYDFWPEIANNLSSIRYYAPGAVNGTWQSLPGEGLKNLDIDTYRAYMLFVRGNRSVKSTGSGPTTLRATGYLKQGSFNVTIPGNNAYTLVSNPYASPIDFEQVYQSSGGILHQFLIWNSNLSNYGAWQLVDGAGGPGNYTIVPFNLGGTPEANDNARFIQSSQGFLVRPNGSGGTLSVTEAAKAPDQTAATLINPFRETPLKDKKLYINLNLANGDTTSMLADGVLARFDAVYAKSVDEDDTRKEPNFNENLAIESASGSLMVEARPEIAKTDTLQLRLWNVTKRGYQFQMKAERFDSLATLHAWLEDRYLGTKEEISLSGAVSSFSFVVTSDSLSWKADRFRIVFQNQGAVLPVTLTSLTATAKEGGVEVGWKVSNEVNMKGYTLQRSTDGGRTFTAIAAQEARNAAGAATASYAAFDASPLKGGDNLYRIRMEEREGGESYSQVVKVTIGEAKGSAEIVLYPNPVREGRAWLQLSQLAKGSYALAVYSAAGQRVYERKIVVGSGSVQTEEVKLGKAVAAGSYTLVLTNSNGEAVFQTKLMVND